MEWFKHKTASHDDPDIADCMDIFGDAGYTVFFIICEIYGQEYTHLNEGWLNISQTFVRRKLRKSWTKVEKVLSFYQEKNRILYIAEHGRVKIKIPNFIELASNWSKRKQAQPTEAPTEAPTAIEVDKEEDIDKKKSKRKRFVPPTFQEVENYISEKGYQIDPHKWYDHYTANGWMVGKNKMKNWKAAVRTWIPGKTVKQYGII